MNEYFWSPQQKQVLKDAYSTGGLKAAVEAIPAKKRNAIATEAHRLGLTSPRPRKPKTNGRA